MSSPDRPDPSEAMQKIAAGLLEFGEALSAVVQFLQGYKAQMEAAGFSPTAAEAMSVDLHRELVPTFFLSVKK